MCRQLEQSYLDLKISFRTTSGRNYFKRKTNITQTLINNKIVCVCPGSLSGYKKGTDYKSVPFLIAILQ